MWKNYQDDWSCRRKFSSQQMYGRDMGGICSVMLWSSETQSEQAESRVSCLNLSWYCVNMQLKGEMNVVH